MAVNHVEQHRGQRLINAQRFGSHFKCLMGAQIAGGKQLIPDDRAIELRGRCPPASRHFHDGLQQRRLGINHPVAVAVALRHRIMNLARIDEAQFTRPGSYHSAADPVNIHATNHRADHITLMGMGRKHVGAESSRKALKFRMPLHPPERRLVALSEVIKGVVGCEKFHAPYLAGQPGNACTELRLPAIPHAAEPLRLVDHLNPVFFGFLEL